ncbi:MAG TPA: DJ-1/PfpI family protein [Rhabdaerophilum sp.]|nr:DJ-1/PfpI family protein [Rhabdaerophilum sp.]
MSHTPPIVVVVFPGVQPLDVAGPAAVFARARALCPNAPPVVYASPEGGVVAGDGGLRIADTVPLADLRAPYDLVMIAGGTESGLMALRETTLYGWLAEAAPQARRVGSVCGGAFVLARAGLLSGRRATTHWVVTDRLQAGYPDVRVEPDAIFTIDGPVCTSAGVTAGIDLALALVEIDHGAEIAAAIARELVVFLRRPGGQSQYSEALKAQSRGSGPIQRVVGEILAQPARDHRIARLAESAAMSPRNFVRRFSKEIGRPPAAFVAAMRLDHAKRLLATTDLSLASVAHASGYASAEAMHHVFRSRLGVTPGDCRNRFATAAAARSSTER